MASYTKRGKTWQYRVNRIVDGKRKQISKSGFKTKKEAQIAAAEFETNEKGYIQNVEEISLSAYFEKWIELYKKNTHKNTYSRYLINLKKVQEYFKDKPMSKITRSDYQEFLNVTSSTRSKETIRKLHTQIKACVLDALDENVITNNFVKKAIVGGAVPPKSKDDKFLNYEESKILYDYLINNLSSTSEYAILFALVSGARFAEVVGLTPDCFNFEKNTVYIYRTWDYKFGNGFDNLKVLYTERYVTLNSEVMEIFKVYMKCTKENEHNLIFYKDTRSKTLTNNGANKILGNILKRLGLPLITFHGLRHTHR